MAELPKDRLQAVAWPLSECNSIPRWCFGAGASWHGVRVSQLLLTHASCAILVWLKAPAAALVAATAVPAIGVDADGLVPGTDEGEFSALICVCKRVLSVRRLGRELGASSPSSSPNTLDSHPSGSHAEAIPLPRRLTASPQPPCCIAAAPPSLMAAAQSQPCLLPQHSALAAPCDTMVPLWSCSAVPFPGRVPGRQLYLALSHVAGSHLPLSVSPMGLCYSILGTSTPVLPAATHLHSVHSRAGRIPARTAFGKKQRLLGWGRISPGQPLSQQSPAPCFCPQSLTTYTHTWPSPPAGQA